MNRLAPIFCSFAMILGLLLTSSQAFAAAPETLTYAGKLAQDGEAFEGSVDVSFELYDAETGGQSVWSEEFDQLDVSEGRFIVELGATNPIADKLDGNKYWLEVSVNGQPLSPRSSVGSVPYALKAGDAKTIGGLEPSQLKIDTTALEARIADLESRLADAENNITTLQIDVTKTMSESNGLRMDVDNLLTAIASLASQMDLDALTTRVVDLETKTAAMSAQTIDGKAAVVFEAVNLHIHNGLGATNGLPANPGSLVNNQVNGLGNLIVGYDEARDTGSNKSGSHNLVVGVRHNYTSFGSLVAGRENTTSGPYTSVSGGRNNTALGDFASVSGGSGNDANAAYSSISGGFVNVASGDHSSVSSGYLNTAAGSYSSVAGGSENTANGRHSSVSGGERNTASGRGSSVSGGSSGLASSQFSTVSGGLNRSATSPDSWRAGGLFQSN